MATKKITPPAQNPNDQRANVKNTNNDQKKTADDNRALQIQKSKGNKKK